MTPQRLRVDLVLLREMATRLGHIRDDLDAAPDEVDDHARATGAQVAGSLDRFSGDWAPRRRQLADLIERLSGLVAEAADRYGSVDGALTGRFDREEARP